MEVKLQGFFFFLKKIIILLLHFFFKLHFGNGNTVKIWFHASWSVQNVICVMGKVCFMSWTACRLFASTLLFEYNPDSLLTCWLIFIPVLPHVFPIRLVLVQCSESDCQTCCNRCNKMLYPNQETHAGFPIISFMPSGCYRRLHSDQKVLALVFHLD